MAWTLQLSTNVTVVDSDGNTSENTSNFLTTQGDASGTTVTPTGASTKITLSDIPEMMSIYAPTFLERALSDISNAASTASDDSCAVNLFDGTPFSGQDLGNTSFGFGAFDPAKVTSPSTKPTAETTAFGYGALNGCTTGRVQTAFGYKALFQSNGWQNSAFGDMAGFAVTTGNDNTMIGTHAGRCITTAQGNTAIGHGSMGGADDDTVLPLGTSTVTTGGNNTGLGAWTLQALSKGIENVAVGAQCCQALTTGSDNVVVGTLALAVATDASQNTILGSYAGQMSDATANVFVGAGVGQYNTTGGYNVYIGTGAAKSITTGGNNVIIGAMAAQGWNGGDEVSTVDHDCTFIGANVMRSSSIPTTTALENMIIIGSGASGDLSNTVFIGAAGTTAAYLGGTSKTGDKILTASQSGKPNGFVGLDSDGTIPIALVSSSSSTTPTLGTLDSPWANVYISECLLLDGPSAGASRIVSWDGGSCYAYNSDQQGVLKDTSTRGARLMLSWLDNHVADYYYTTSDKGDALTWSLTTTAFYPGTDNTQSIGTATSRISQLFAGTSTVNTSDATEKTLATDSSPFTLAQIKMALRPLMTRLYQWNDMILKKGADGARYHVGYLAQDVQAALQAANIDPTKTALWCNDALTQSVKKSTVVAAKPATTSTDATTGKTTVISPAVEEHTVITQEDVPVLNPDGTQKYRQGLRMDLVHAVMIDDCRDRIASLESQYTTLLSRITALESK